MTKNGRLVIVKTREDILPYLWTIRLGNVEITGRKRASTSFRATERAKAFAKRWGIVLKV